MKKQLLLTACAFVLAIAGVALTRASAKFAVFYTDSGAPAACTLGSLPPGCTTVNTGNLCRVVNGTTFTYYTNSSCTIPYYKQP